jgi:hypothetical protein
MVWYTSILTFAFPDTRQEDKIPWASSFMQFWSVSVVPKHLNLPHLQRTCSLSLTWSIFSLSSEDRHKNELY